MTPGEKTGTRSHPRNDCSERVAELRRRLPQDTPIQDYQSQEGPPNLNAGDATARSVRLSELFTVPSRSFVIYHFMLGNKQSKACPMGTTAPAKS